MPLEGRLQVLRHQIQVTGNVPQTLGVQSAKVFGQCLPGVHVRHVGQGEHAQIGELAKGRSLQGGDLGVVQLGHIMISQRITGGVVDLEAEVELQHVEQLRGRKGSLIGDPLPLKFNNIPTDLHHPRI